MGSPYIRLNEDDCSPAILVDQGHRTDTGAELQPHPTLHPYPEPDWYRAFELKTIIIWAKLQLYFSTNQDLGIGDFLRNLSLGYSYPVLTSWFIQL